MQLAHTPSALAVVAGRDPNVSAHEHAAGLWERGRVVLLSNRSPGLGIAANWSSTGRCNMRSAAPSLERVARAFRANETCRGRPARRISRSTYRLASADARREASLGRLFTAEEDSQTPAVTAILGYGTWVRRYGSDPTGRRADPSRERTAAQSSASCRGRSRLPHEVVPTLGLAADADLVIPFPIPPAAAQARNREDYNMVGKLKPGRDGRGNLQE